MKKKVLKNIFGSFFAFVTALFLLAAAVFAAGYITTTEQHIYYCTDKSRYCENSAKLIENDLNDITVPSGLPEGFFTGKGDTAELEKINRDCIAKNYSGKEFTADTAKIEADLVKYFTDFASQNELQMGDEIDTEAIADLAKTCSESYTDFGANLVFEYLSIIRGSLIYSCFNDFWRV
ncbi:MAG: hypothetical protein KBS52_06630 [Clostridiales bacterium]|nr:hypothetical protein [Candidatus Equinaster intestinalis]